MAKEASNKESHLVLIDFHGDDAIGAMSHFRSVESQIAGEQRRLVEPPERDYDLVIL
jgi:hypothetical protein